MRCGKSQWRRLIEMIDPRPDFDAAMDFLQRWAPGGPWVLTAINPRDKGIQTLACVDPDRLRNTLAHWSDRRWGIYFQVNPDRRDPAAIRSKAAKTDIAEARWLHCDLDIYKDGQDAMAKLRHVAGPPTVVTSSGHGVQAFWRLQQPVGPDDIERVETRNAWLARELGGDSTFDVSRIMRLPGCINWPNQRKQAMGLGPALAKLISWDDKLAYDLEIFPVLAGSRARAADLDFDIKTPDLATLPPRLKAIHDDGRALGVVLADDDSGSAWAFRLAIGLCGHGWPVEMVAGYLLTSDWLAGRDDDVAERQARRTAARAARWLEGRRLDERDGLMKAIDDLPDEREVLMKAIDDLPDEEDGNEH